MHVLLLTPARTHRGGDPLPDLTSALAPLGLRHPAERTLGDEAIVVADRAEQAVDVIRVADQPVVVDEAVSQFTRALFEAVAIVLAISFISLGLRAGLVGTPEQVTARIREYEAAGVDLVLLQFSPQREEMARFGEQVIARY